MEPEEPTGGHPADEADAAGQTDRAGAPDDLPVSPEASTALPPKIEAWRRRSAAGAILTGFALGLQEALETRQQEPSIVMETSGEPPRDLPVEAEFEYGRPRQSVVQIRPWLLSGEAAGEKPAAGDDDIPRRGREDGDDEHGSDR